MSTRRPLRTAEVSDLTGIPVSTLRYYRHRGEGPPSYKLGGSVVYDAVDLDAWRAGQRERSLRGEGAATA